MMTGKLFPSAAKVAFELKWDYYGVQSSLEIVMQGRYPPLTHTRTKVVHIGGKEID